MRLLSRFSLLVCLIAGLSLSATAKDSPAETQGFQFKKGVSIAHWMAKVWHPDGPGANWFSKPDLEWLAQQGFDHVRFPVDGRHVIREDGSVDAQKIAPFVQAMHWARELGMGSVLDMHFLPGGVYNKDHQDTAIYTDPQARATAADCWRQLAKFFKDEGSYLRYEIINEPEAPVNEQLNLLNDVSIAAIREHDKDRIIYATCNLSSRFSTLADMRVPADPKVAILVHYDEPSIFTHQRASWKQCPPDMPAVPFPGKVPDFSKLFPPDHWAAKESGRELSAAEIDQAFAEAEAWIQKHAPGREVYLGEFGVYQEAPALDRANYVEAVSQAAARRGWGWCIWAYNGWFGIRGDDGKATPTLEGLFRKHP